MRENKNYFKKSISKYLTISLILLIFIITCGIVSFQYFKSLDDIYNKLDNDGNDQIRKLSEVSAKAIWDIDQGAIDSIGGVFLANENVNSLKISADTVLFYKNKNNKDLIIKEKEVMYQGKKIGKVEISINKMKYQENINNLFFSNMQLLFLVILTLSLVTSFLVKYFLSKPLGNLKEEISHVKRGDYTTDGISEEYAEFTDIIKSFKDMAEIIKNREIELIESNRKIEEAAKEKSEILLNMNAELEKKVNERTIELKKSMEYLKEAQQRIIEVEKMASLGTLVAGVAHEVNTPLGVCLTASSYLQEKTETFKKEYEKENISRDDLEEYISTAYESTYLIMKNIERADELIHSFKQIAVDQSTEEKREFNLKGYIYWQWFLCYY